MHSLPAGRAAVAITDITNQQACTFDLKSIVASAEVRLTRWGGNRSQVKASSPEGQEIMVIIKVKQIAQAARASMPATQFTGSDASLLQEVDMRSVCDKVLQNVVAVTRDRAHIFRQDNEGSGWVTSSRPRRGGA